MNILLVTYTYPPSKSVNGFRPYYFAKALVKAGHRVSVLTRHFRNEEKHEDYNLDINTPLCISMEEEISILRIPHRNTWFKYYNLKWIRHTGIWKIVYFIQLLFGRTCQESYNKWFGYFLLKLLNSTQYDKVIVESGPTNLVRLVSKYCIKYKIPYFIDFRDAFYHEMYLKDPSSLNMGKRIKMKLEEMYMKQAIEKAHTCISISDSLHSIIKTPINKRAIIVNGFDESKWIEVEKQTISDSMFRITIAGTLYPFHFLSKFLDAIHLFLENNLQSNIEVLFIAPGSNDLKTIIREKLKSNRVKIIENRIPYEQTIEWMLKSAVLAYHGWEGYRGYASAKIYDYIRAGRYIWIVPSDDDIIDKLLIETNTGESFSNIEEAAIKLSEMYLLWSKGELKNFGRQEKIANYSRTIQSNKIEKILSAP